MLDKLDNINILNTEYTLLKRLSPGIFTEQSLYKSPNNDIILLKEPNMLVAKILNSSPESTFSSFRDNQQINHANFTRIIDIITPQNMNTSIVAIDFNKFNLFNLHQVQKIKSDVVIYYFKQLISILDHLCDKNIYYYTLKMEDIAIDQDNKLKLNEFAIGTAIINNSKGDINSWVDKINTKSGTLAPELFFDSDEDKITCQAHSIVFNLGYILFTLIVGVPPFTKMEDLNYTLISERKHEEFWNKFDPNKKFNDNFKDLVLSMLNLKPFDRPTFQSILENQWIKSSEIPENYVAEEIQKLKDEMFLSTKKLVTIKKTKSKWGSGKVSRCMDDDCNKLPTEKEIKLKKELCEFLEAGLYQYLIEHKDFGKSVTNRTIYFDNKFDEVVKYLVKYYEERY